MLREIRHPHVAPYINAFKIKYTSGTPYADVGYNDVQSITDNGTGDFTINFKRPYSWASGGTWDIVAIGCPLHSNGNLEYYASEATKAKVRIAGAGGDYSHNVITFGWRDRSALNARSVDQRVYCNLNRPRLLAFQLNGTTTPATITSGASGAFSFVRNSTGNYTLTFKNAFSYEPIVVGSCASVTTQRFGLIASGTDATKVTFETYNSGGSPTNSITTLYVIGSDSTDKGGNSDSIIQCNQRRTVLTGFVADRAGGSILVNSTDGTYASGGTGVHTITTAEAFRRATTVVAGATNVSSAVAVRLGTSSATGYTCTSLNSGGSATSSTTHALLLGYRDPGES